MTYISKHITKLLNTILSGHKLEYQRLLLHHMVTGNGSEGKGQKIMHQKSQVPNHITHTLDRGKNSHEEADKKAFL